MVAHSCRRAQRRSHSAGFAEFAEDSLRDVVLDSIEDGILRQPRRRS